MAQPTPQMTAEDRFDLAVAGTWTVALFIGLFTVGIGIIVLAWPSETLTVLSILFGIQLLLFGLFRLISAFSSQTLAPGLVGFIGVISMIGGIVVLRHPFETVEVLAAILGVVWIVGGAIDLIAAFADRTIENRFVHGLLAVLSIVAGIIVVSWPAPTVTVIAWVAGLYLIVFGLVFCFGALKLRRLEN
mgnify:FL=1